MAKDLRYQAKMELTFHNFSYAAWHKLLVVVWADGGQANRPDGSDTCGVLGGIAGTKFVDGDPDLVSILSWRSFKAPRKVAGSNGAECQAMDFGEEQLWLLRLMWCEFHGCTVNRWKLNDVVKSVDGMLITDSKGLYDAMCRHESPQLKLRSARGGEALGAARQQLRASGASVSWVNGLAQLGDCLTKLGATARAPFEKY